MQLTYDELTDTLYVYFSQEPVARSEEIDERFVVDYDARGTVRGIEVLDASKGSQGVDIGSLPRHEDLTRAVQKARELPVFAA
jgi:uncharacterized protein YuzE